MISKHYGSYYSIQELREAYSGTQSIEGISLKQVSDIAETIGFRSIGVRIDFKELKESAPFPCILHWQNNHFVVCYGIKRVISWRKKPDYKIYIADPRAGLITYTLNEFIESWYIPNQNSGLCLTLYPTKKFYENNNSKSNNQQDKGIRSVFNYLTPYRRQILQLITTLLIGSLIQLAIPFLTQSVVDVGIKNQDLGFISLVLIAQLILNISKISVEFVRNWILLHVNTRINVNLISDFLIKLMKLPISFFDTKRIGDIIQRIGDHQRIQQFLTGTSLNVMFSMLNLVIFSVVLAYYNLTILAIIITGNFIHISWVLFFMKKRREFDFQTFEQSAREQSKLIQMVTGMQEIKLNNNEKKKRWEWEHIQAKLYKISLKTLSLEQYQQIGATLFSETASIAATFIAAIAVIEGNMTIGMMLALTYIIGQISAPLSSFIGFAQSLQDAKISLERLNEIHDKEDEEEINNSRISTLPLDRTITISNLFFRYSSHGKEYTLQNINIEIPGNKVTAIVGASGSGKSTLLKLLLGFYTPNKGAVKIGNTSLERINTTLWRENTGAVLQGGMIFSDTIINNIVVDAEAINEEKLEQAVNFSEIRSFVETTHSGYKTQIGMEGSGLSEGQKQRILLARIIYKNPDFMFLDEATNALDSETENKIITNLKTVYKNKTVVIVAHRLSTIKHADKIVVMDNGNVVEEGKHEELINRKSVYYQLFKKQTL
jgi:ATP-binding cassette subfamily B protein